MPAPAKDSHCSYCGSPFPAGAKTWPRACPACGSTTYRNPLPVAVLVVPISGDAADGDGTGGVMLIRRSLPDGRNKLALPGGFINLGESWQAAAARETFEEAGVSVDPADVVHLRTASAPDGTLLVFGACARPLTPAQLPAFVPSAETAERLVVPGPVELAFSLHTEVLRAYFAGRVRP
jgi:ADP-ribose pyrophosphatase YjhB (NUDIX family)